jgi:hypothetical protein
MSDMESAPVTPTPTAPAEARALPTFREADLSFRQNRATNLDAFIVNYEPAGEAEEERFRAGLAAVVKEAEARGAAAERKAAAQTAQDTWAHLSALGSAMTQNYRYACEKAAQRIRARLTSVTSGDRQRLKGNT